MMQYPVYASYPYTNVYSCYNNYLDPGTNQGTQDPIGLTLGPFYGNYYGYQPWIIPQGHPRMIVHNGKSATETPSALANYYFPNNSQQMGSKYACAQYNAYQYPWNTSYAWTNWFNHQRTYNHTVSAITFVIRAILFACITGDTIHTHTRV